MAPAPQESRCDHQADDEHERAPRRIIRPLGEDEETELVAQHCLQDRPDQERANEHPVSSPSDGRRRRPRLVPQHSQGSDHAPSLGTPGLSAIGRKYETFVVPAAGSGRTRRPMRPPRHPVIVVSMATDQKEHIMRTTRTAGVPEQQPASVRTKLAAAWTSFMFLYIYVDYLHLYHPDAIKDILNGVVWKLDITQAFVVGALTLVAIPIFMVLASTTLPARACRLTTIVVASIYVPVSIFNVSGGGGVFFFGLGGPLGGGHHLPIIRTGGE